MSRIRTIKPEFWKNEGLSDLPEATHMLAAALLNYADDEGYFNANPKLIQGECFPLRELSVSIPDSLTRLVEEGYLRLGTGSDGKRYGSITHFTDHQKISHQTESKIKKLEIVWEDSVSPPVVIPEQSSLNGTGKGREQGNARAPEIQIAFSNFVSAYPKRKGNDPTEPARERFARAVRDGVDPEAIIQGARGYAAEQSKLGKVGTEFIKQRKAWLNEKGWLDYQPKTLDGNGHDSTVKPMTWVLLESPQWRGTAERYKATYGRDPPHVAGLGGMGWQFPAEMVSVANSVSGGR